MKALEGRIAVITGGNSGIGLATAKLFVEEGAQVIITARRKSMLDEAVAQIGNGAIGVQGDVAEISHHEELASEIKRMFGGIDVYVANAGVINLTPTSEVTEAEYDQQFAVNTRGTFFGVQTLSPLFRKGASVILTSSLAATKVLPGHTVYAGSKAAMAAFARNWAIEFKERRIRFNILSPGPVDTAILTKLGIPAEEREPFLAHMAEMIPAGRMGSDLELAQAALFLASDASSFVNGVELHADGGMSLV